VWAADVLKAIVPIGSSLCTVRRRGMNPGWQF